MAFGMNGAGSLGQSAQNTPKNKARNAGRQAGSFLRSGQIGRQYQQPQAPPQQAQGGMGSSFNTSSWDSGRPSYFSAADKGWVGGNQQSQKQGGMGSSFNTSSWDNRGGQSLSQPQRQSIWNAPNGFLQPGQAGGWDPHGGDIWNLSQPQEGMGSSFNTSPWDNRQEEIPNDTQSPWHQSPEQQEPGLDPRHYELMGRRRRNSMPGLRMPMQELTDKPPQDNSNWYDGAVGGALGFLSSPIRSMFR